MTGQLTFAGLDGRCGFVQARTEDGRSGPCVLVCVAAPHDDDTAHHLEWREDSRTWTRVALVLIEGDRL
jgi:hypothetical protein